MKKILFVFVSLVLFIFTSCGSKYDEIIVQISEGTYNTYVNCSEPESRNALPTREELVQLTEIWASAAGAIAENSSLHNVDVYLTDVYLIVVDKSISNEINNFNYKDFINNTNDKVHVYKLL